METKSNPYISTQVNVKKCPVCEGKGSRYSHSHDCWGKTETYLTVCYTCSGSGFIIDREDMLKIKKNLGL